MAETGIIAQASAKVTTDNYASALKIVRPPNIKDILIHLTENNVNAVLYQILGSNVDTASKYKTLITDAPLAKAGVEYETLSDPWIFIDVQIKAAVGSAQGSVNVDVSGV